MVDIIYQTVLRGDYYEQRIIGIKRTRERALGESNVILGIKIRKLCHTTPNHVYNLHEFMKG